MLSPLPDIMFRKAWPFIFRPSVSFQVLSDLHLEINQQYSSFEFPLCAPYLILAGDIGRLVDYDEYRNFLQRQTERFKLVFLVLGNHEFYNGTFKLGAERAMSLENEPCLGGRLIVLHQRRVSISNITILGCTLWSKVPDDSKEVVSSKIKDFQKIDNWTVGDHNASHDADRAWLLNEIQSIQQENKNESNQKQTILLITHHAPSLTKTSSPQHSQNAWTSAFGTDLLSQPLNWVKTWVFGHTHYSTDFKERGIRVVSNQRGYVLNWSDSKNKDDKFDVRKVIHV